MSSVNIKVSIDNLLINVVISDELVSLYNGSSSLHNHHSFEFHYVREGALEFEFGAKKLESEPGKIYLIAPHTYHAVNEISENLKRISLIFNFRENKACKTDFDAYSYYTGIYSKADSISVIDLDSSYLDDLFECQEDFVTNEKIDYEMFSALFLIIFKKMTAGISRKNAIFHSKTKNDFYEASSDTIRAMNAEYFMETHYRDEISVEDLAKYLNLSPRHTNRFLKEYMKTSFNEFICRYRIELAKTFLMEFDVPVKDVAERVGYKSYNGFLKAFKIITGQTPTDFAQRHKPD